MRILEGTARRVLGIHDVTPFAVFVRYKIPISTLVVVHTPQLDVLLLERADFAEHWQSVTGSQEAGESLAQTARRELREETGIEANAYGGVVDWHMQNDFEIYTKWAARYPPGTTHTRRISDRDRRRRATPPRRPLLNSNRYNLAIVSS